MAKPLSDVRERFNTRYRVAPSGCWEWTGALHPMGYAKFAVKENGTWRLALAHRVAYELYKGTIPAGLQLDHLCRVRHCVNPDHLEPVTNRVNMLRGNAPAAISVRTNRCKRGHEFTPGTTIINSVHGGRQCRVCVREWQRNRSRAEGRAVNNSDKVHCKRGHEFTPENTIVQSRGRKCRACNRALDRRRYAAKRGSR